MKESLEAMRESSDDFMQDHSKLRQELEEMRVCVCTGVCVLVCMWCGHYSITIFNHIAVFEVLDFW